jgi:hypothetical protein
MSIKPAPHGSPTVLLFRHSQECDETIIASLQAQVIRCCMHFASNFVALSFSSHCTQVDAFLADITTQGVRAAMEPEVSNCIEFVGNVSMLL